MLINREYLFYIFELVMMQKVTFWLHIHLYLCMLFCILNKNSLTRQLIRSEITVFSGKSTWFLAGSDIE